LPEQFVPGERIQVFHVSQLDKRIVKIWRSNAAALSGLAPTGWPSPLKCSVQRREPQTRWVSSFVNTIFDFAIDWRNRERNSFVAYDAFTLRHG